MFFKKEEVLMGTGERYATGVEALEATVRNLYTSSRPDVQEFAMVLDNIHAHIRQEMEAALNEKPKKKDKK